MTCMWMWICMLWYLVKVSWMMLWQLFSSGRKQCGSKFGLDIYQTQYLGQLFWTVKSWVINFFIIECELNIYFSQPKEFFVRRSATETYLYMYLHAMSSMVWINKSRSLDCALFYCKARRKRLEHERSDQGNMRRSQIFLPSSLVARSLGNGLT